MKRYSENVLIYWQRLQTLGKSRHKIKLGLKVWVLLRQIYLNLFVGSQNVGLQFVWQIERQGVLHNIWDTLEASWKIASFCYTWQFTRYFSGSHHYSSLKCPILLAMAPSHARHRSIELVAPERVTALGHRALLLLYFNISIDYEAPCITQWQKLHSTHIAAVLCLWHMTTANVYCCWEFRQ